MKTRICKHFKQLFGKKALATRNNTHFERALLQYVLKQAYELAGDNYSASSLLIDHILTSVNVNFFIFFLSNMRLTLIYPEKHQCW